MEYYVKSYASHAAPATEGTGLGYTEESQSLKIYFEELSFHCDGRLSRTEEAELADRIRQGDMQARDRLVRSNLPFVVTVAKRFQRRGLGLDDLIGAGGAASMHAARRPIREPHLSAGQVVRVAEGHRNGHDPLQHARLLASILAQSGPVIALGPDPDDLRDGDDWRRDPAYL